LRGTDLKNKLSKEKLIQSMRDEKTRNKM